MKGDCYLKESKEDMLSGALKVNVINVGETKEEDTQKKRDERKKTLHEGKLQVSPKCRLVQTKRQLCI